MNPFAPIAERVAFPGATSVANLPLKSASLLFGGDLMTYTTTPELLKTVAALAVPTATASGNTLTTGIANKTSATKSTTQSATKSAPFTEFTGAATGMPAAKGAALAGAFGIAAFFV